MANIWRAKLLQLRYFDISLRDGLQSMTACLSLYEKKNLLHRILYNNQPHSIEVGSLVSQKKFPQMRDSIDLYRFAVQEMNKKKVWEEIALDQYKSKSSIFLLVPSTPKHIEAAKAAGVRNISLITSVSDAFQQKNVQKSVAETKMIFRQFLNPEYIKMGSINYAYNNNVDNAVVYTPFDNIKLYISCISQCPLIGWQNPQHIISEVLEYATMPQLSEICLSDTCGTLKYTEFKYMIDFFQRVGGIELINRLSLHLHLNNRTRNRLEIQDNHDAIIQYAVNNGIYKFDVTSLENIGEEGWYPNDHFNRNLSYNRLHRSITK
jgi:isopropylmalate/homocitrate/citramalate synthase